MTVSKAALALGVLAIMAAVGIIAAVTFRQFSDDQPDTAFDLAGVHRALGVLPLETLSEQEKDELLILREGTKLSHDVYDSFAQRWELTVFASNAFNGQSHADAVGLLLTRYALPDPAEGKVQGEFAYADFRDLYASLIEGGAESELAALRQAMLLEELGIIYVKNLLAHTDNQDLELVYTALLRGAALNLRDFVRANDSLGGEPYQPQQLTPAEFNEALTDSLDELGEGSLLLRATDFGRCGIDDFELPRRREETDTDSVDEELHQNLCATEISVAGSATRLVDLGSGLALLRLLPTAPSNLPAPVDSNSPVFRKDGAITIFNSWDDATFRSTGEEVDNLARPVQVQLPRPARPGSVWLEAVWQDPESPVLYGWYHLEPSDLPCAPLTAPIIGAAVSRDGGATWEDRGPVLEAGYEFDCDYRNGYFTGGHGDFTVLLGPDGQYFYFLFSNYAGPLEEQGIGVARSFASDRGQPGTMMKYYNGAWDEPGIGGHVTPIFPAVSSWHGPYVDALWGPSVHWNPSIQSYVALLNHTADDSETWLQEGIYISFSQDLLNWTQPDKLLESNNWYPQVLGLSQRGTDSYAERYMRVYVGGISSLILELRPP